MIPFPRYLIRPPIEYGRRDMHAGEFIPCSLAVSCLTEKSAPPYYWELPCNTMGLNPFRRSIHVFMYLYLISYHGIFSEKQLTAKFFMNSGQNSDRNVTHNMSCTLQICTYMGNTTKSCIFEIPQNSCIFEIPRKVVFLKIFLHSFKCTNYSLYDMIFFSKNTTRNTIYPLYLGQ